MAVLYKASSYNGSIGDFESFGVGPIPALAANVEVYVLCANWKNLVIALCKYIL